MDEKDVGFRLGPRINAVGRLQHASKVVEAFIHEEPEPLIEYMHSCNEKRKQIQAGIVEEARALAAQQSDAPILFLGGDWHPGVVGIAASKIAEEFWRPVWLFQRKEGLAKGSARSIPGFNVTTAMTHAGGLFIKFGGHAAAGGFSFDLQKEDQIKQKIIEYASQVKSANEQLWQSQIEYDCSLPLGLTDLRLSEILDNLKPFGHGFEEPRFCLEAEIEDVRFYKDKITGAPKHTAVQIKGPAGKSQKVMFFNDVHEELLGAHSAKFLVSASKNHWRGVTSLSLMASDFELI